MLQTNKRSLSHRKPVCGIGINDSNYIVSPKINGSQDVCPYYSVWERMIKRCYSKPFLMHNISYEGCIVCDEWHSFMNFRAWMERQDWQGKELDKDILVKGNDVYSPDTCCFVSKELNALFNNERRNRTYLTGVSYHKRSGRFVARCNYKGNTEHLGYFSEEEDAHKAYSIRRHAVIREYAAKESDIRIKRALLNRMR